MTPELDRRQFLKMGATIPIISRSQFQRVPEADRNELLEEAIRNPDLAIGELCRRDYSEFVKEFWSCVSSDPLVWNWHMDYIGDQLVEMAKRVAFRQPKLHDLLINVPPGTSKSTLCSIMYQPWCWTNWPWLRFINASYAAPLSLEHAEYSRDLIRSQKFRSCYPNLDIKQDKDTKSNFRIVYKEADGTWRTGGNRFSTSVGVGSIGYHGHILMVDDPLNPKEAVSDVKVKSANHWMSQTLSTRKIDKRNTPIILIMQRLHQNDPSGNMLGKKKKVFHICLPGEIHTYRKKVRPIELISRYQDGLLDPQRMPLTVLEGMEDELGQYGYAGQVGQDPTPPGGGMFKVDHLQIVDSMSDYNIVQTVRAWDNAASEEATAAFSAGVKMSTLRNGKILVHESKRGRWATEEREDIKRETAEADGRDTIIVLEQEPGSGGKDQAEASVRNLAGFKVEVINPRGDKPYRADPFSVQVNHGNVLLLRGDWNKDFIEELRYFPHGTYRDQTDAGSNGFNYLTGRRLVRTR